MSTGTITRVQPPSTTRYGRDFRPAGQIKPYLSSSGCKEDQEHLVSSAALMKSDRFRLKEDLVHSKLLKTCGLGTTSGTWCAWISQSDQVFPIIMVLNKWVLHVKQPATSSISSTISTRTTPNSISGRTHSTWQARVSQDTSFLPSQTWFLPTRKHRFS